MLKIKYNNEEVFIDIYDKEKVEKEIIPNTFGLKDPVHLIKKINGYNIYAGVTNCDEIVWYATAA